MSLALVAGILVPGATAGAAPAVRVAVTTDRFQFADTTLTASYAITCARGARCPAARAARPVDVRRREVRRARLGFGATRASEPVGPPETPGTTVQDESVTVDVTQAGALVVTLSGTKTATVDAAPVAGTASSGGRVTGRTVRWSLAAAKPGQYTFGARFRVVADLTAVGSYATQAVVERSAAATTMLAHAWGAQPAGGRVRTVSALTFRGRVAPPYGAPRGRGHGWQVGRDRDGLAELFEGSVSMDAYGTYSGASGAVGAASFLDLRRVAPGVKVTSLGVSYSWWRSFPEVKFEPETDRLFEEDGPGGLSLSLCALAPSADGAGSTLYDRDAGTVSAFADTYMIKAARKGPPRNDRGRLRASWSGRLLSGTSSYTARSAIWDETFHDSFFSHGANIGWMVTGGDLDNRDGSRPVEATPAVVRVPRGERMGSVMASTSILWDTEFRPRLSVDKAWSAATIGGTVGEGGYWLRSTRRGYDRDWSTNTAVVIASEPRGARPAAAAERVTTTVRVVPEGTTTLVQYAVPGEPVRRLTLDPGVWLVSGGADGLRAAAVTPPAPRCDGRW